MSDDKFLGSALWCVPRKLFVLLLAMGTLIFGVQGVVQTFLLRQLPGEAGSAAWQSQERCIGHTCNDVLTCRGLREASFHMREAIFVFAASLFGYWGVLGALHGYIDDLLWFANFLVSCIIILVVLVAIDGIYTLGCGEFPLHVIDEAIMWPFPNIPVRDVVKVEIREAMVSYPVNFVNRLANVNIFLVYLAVELGTAVFLTYCAHQVMCLAQLNRHGSLGLGATFDMNAWRTRMLPKTGPQNDDGYGATSVA